ncbi:type II toxin-antitoxin system death-on-curing family toxin [Candidatus Saccharibacteria bacterium]|nr:type II toxin-antitoxin system death-on-curing family toxin [Candidatus Saccharibacteria bacterium]
MSNSINGGQKGAKMTEKSEEKQLAIYKADSFEVVFNVDAEEETIWATQAQIAELFDTTVPNINMHLKRVYLDGELEEKRTIKKNLIVRTEGKREVRREVSMYNLDAIISVGYRVNSRKATDFRIWATKTLKQYIVGGVAVNERRLKQLSAKRLADVENMMGVVRRLIARQELDAGEANGVLEVISKYAGSFEMLKEYDDGFIDLSYVNEMGGKKAGGKADKKAGRVKELTPELCEEVVASLRTSVNGGELFGKVRNGSFAGALSAIYQSFDGEDLYPSVAEKAANLLYFVIKDHPFYDGNKRIGSLLFIVFLTMNDYHLTEKGETKISDRALTALALLIAESEPSEKGLIVNLTRKLLDWK